MPDDDDIDDDPPPGPRHQWIVVVVDVVVEAPPPLSGIHAPCGARLGLITKGALVVGPYVDLVGLSHASGHYSPRVRALQWRPLPCCRLIPQVNAINDNDKSFTIQSLTSTILQITPEALPKVHRQTSLMTSLPQTSTIHQVMVEVLPKFHR